MAPSQRQREFTYNTDSVSFVTAVMPELWQRIESRVHPLAQERGLQVRRKDEVVKTTAGHLVGGIHNMTWSARNGLAAGFTVTLTHDPLNYLKVKVSTGPYYPVAAATSLVLGLLISFFWIPYLVGNWNALWSNPLFLGLFVIMWILLLVATRTIFVSAILAGLSTFVFGFVVGYALGYGIGMAMGNSKHGMKINPALVSIIQGLSQPSARPFAPAGYGQAVPVAYAPPPAVAYRPASFAAAPPAAPAPVPRLAGNRRGPRPPQAPAAAPPAPQPPRALPPLTAAPAAPADVAPCPQCQQPVAIGAAACAACGLALVWG
jgi:hypothetical protein